MPPKTARNKNAIQTHLVEPHRHHVLLLEPLQRQDEQLGVVLVVEGRERDGREPGGWWVGWGWLRQLVKTGSAWD